MFRPLALSSVIACNALAADAHEFWILANPAQVEPDEQIVATLHVGEKFKGSELAFLPPNFRQFSFGFNGELADVPGRIGDRPAIDMPAPGEGLVVLVHVTTDNSITWDTWEDFESFALHKDSEETLTIHRERGLPDKDFKEIYSRYAKALVGVGSSAGADRPWGLLTEIVALENPYTDDMTDGIDVALLYEGNPRSETQIEVFAKNADDEVSISTVMTDKDGHATIPVAPGMAYMLDAVVIREPSNEQLAATNAVWESLWANLTFAVPVE